MKGLKVNSELKGTFSAIIFSIVIAWFIITFIGQRTVVDGHSMENTLFHGDNLLIDKVSYDFEEPERFDIIVFPHEIGGEKKYYIKRIIGLPGEEIYIDSRGFIYINGKLLKERFGREIMESPGIASSPIVLKEGEYFVLGDNRNHSSDSRDSSVGLVQSDKIIGKAFFRIYPFSKIGFLE